jgi:dTDP-4-dehydrorhamnose reductase
MRALVFGPTGQVGRELLRLAPGLGIETVPVSRAEADLADPDAIARVLRDARTDVIVNAAAYTAVDQAEDEPELALAINAVAPAAMAAAAAERGVPFLHVSTDYVFEGLDGPPKREDDPAGPVSAYGASKLEGERDVMAADPDAVILRTAWVFSAHGKNFVKTMLSVGRGRDEMRVVADQQGGPTAARDIAGALWTIAAARLDGRGAAGIYHYAALPSTDWAEFAAEIFRRAGWDSPPRVAPIRSDEWPTRARRPAHSILDCTKIRDTFGIGQPDWRPALDDVIRDLSVTSE